MIPQKTLEVPCPSFAVKNPSVNEGRGRLSLPGKEVAGTSWKRMQGNGRKTVGWLEKGTRKMRTLFSLVHSGVLVVQDGIDFRSMAHHERLHYIEFRPYLNFKKDVVVYDIGANVGEFARFFARFPWVSTIYCFEPVKSVFQDLVKRTEEIPGVRSFPIALGDRNGLRQMNVNDFDPSSSLLPMDSIHVEEFPESGNMHEEEVQMMTLREAVNALGLAPPDFIKMDVQGFEDRVIRGGEEIVKQARYCMLELSLVGLYKESMLITDMNSLMRGLGFRLVELLGKVIGRSGELLQVDGLYRNEDRGTGGR